MRAFYFYDSTDCLYRLSKTLSNYYFLRFSSTIYFDLFLIEDSLHFTDLGLEGEALLLGLQGGYLHCGYLRWEC
jgi:hypothetical protein